MPEHVTLYDFLSGAVSFGFLICGLFFLRFWRRTRDELFIAFALAFALLGIVQATLALANIPTEERAPIYLFRLLAFVIILFAIFRKNRASA
jgi:uncharacterized membrane protein YoaK (UPF0700 family)